MAESYFEKSGLDKLEALKGYFNESAYTVVFTGAGMSTEAGLPDFRSALTGMWNHVNPLELASTKAMRENREQFIEFYRNRVEGLRACKPHQGHSILAKWEKQGRIKSIITQNVDGFHHAAGNTKVSELHGTLRTSHCNECGYTYPIDRFVEGDFTCPCGGFIRPSVVLFGEQLPEEALKEAFMEAERAELFIVLGSSLTVSPANFFPLEAKEKGAKLIIINMESTELDEAADLLIQGEKIGSVLQKIGI